MAARRSAHQPPRRVVPNPRQPQAHPDPARALLAAVRRDLLALVKTVAWIARVTFQTAHLFDQLRQDETPAAHGEDWRHLGCRLLDIARAVDRLRVVSEIDPQLVELRRQEVEALRATWRVHDEREFDGMEDKNAPGDSTWAAAVADVKAQIAHREGLFSAILGNFQEVTVILRRRAPKEE